MKESRKSLLLKRMDELKVQAKKAFGQNFLISDHVIEKIIEQVKAYDRTQWCEIGPGLGALTEDLKLSVKDLRLIELDKPLVEYWQGRGFQVIDQDALRSPWKTWETSKPMGLVSNLPYQISTHLVVELCISEHPFDRLVLMFQKEVAERLTAKPRGDAYGLLSVITQLFWKLNKVADARPGDFFPAPKIASRVLSFEKKPAPMTVADAQRFLGLLKGVFTQRRKVLRKTLGLGWPKPISDEQKDRIWSELKLKSEVRAEELSPEQWFALFQLLR